MSTHACHAPDCEIQVPFERFACRVHWFQVPKPLRDRLNDEWRKTQREGLGEAYLAAWDDCVRALGGDPDA
jgi:hypothetical protein